MRLNEFICTECRSKTFMEYEVRTNILTCPKCQGYLECVDDTTIMYEVIDKIEKDLKVLDEDIILNFVGVVNSDDIAFINLDTHNGFFINSFYKEDQEQGVIFYKLSDYKYLKFNYSIY